MGAEDNYIDDLQNRYRDKLEKQLGVPTQTQQSGIAAPIVSREYSQFKEEAMSKQLGFYEKACNWAEKTIKIKPDEKKAAEIKESIDIVHLNITPTGVTSLSIIAPLAVFVFGSFISFLFLQSFFFVFFFLFSVKYRKVKEIP